MNLGVAPKRLPFAVAVAGLHAWASVPAAHATEAPPDAADTVSETELEGEGEEEGDANDGTVDPSLRQGKLAADEAKKYAGEVRSALSDLETASREERHRKLDRPSRQRTA
jgi:hypothetical protein